MCDSERKSSSVAAKKEKAVNVESQSDELATIRSAAYEEQICARAQPIG